MLIDPNTQWIRAISDSTCIWADGLECWGSNAKDLFSHLTPPLASREKFQIYSGYEGYTCRTQGRQVQYERAINASAFSRVLGSMVSEISITWTLTVSSENLAFSKVVS